MDACAGQPLAQVSSDLAACLAGMTIAVNDDGPGVALKFLEMLEEKGVGFLFVEQERAGDVGGGEGFAGAGVDPHDVATPLLLDDFQRDFIAGKRFIFGKPMRRAWMEKVGADGGGEREQHEEECLTKTRRRGDAGTRRG